MSFLSSSRSLSVNATTMPRIAQLVPESSDLALELANKAKPAIISIEQLFAVDMITLAAHLNRPYTELMEFRCLLVRRLLVSSSICSDDVDHDDSNDNVQQSSLTFLPDVLHSSSAAANNRTNNDINSSNSAKRFVSSGCSQLDAMLGCSGFPRGQVTCLIGEASTGKSQICLQSSVVSALHQDQGRHGSQQQQGLHVLYIDTHNQVFPRRLHSLLTAALLDEQLTCSTVLSQDEKKERMTAALGHINVQRCFDLFHCLDILTRLLDSSHNTYDDAQQVRFDLIILDGLHPLLAPLQGGGDGHHSHHHSIQPIIAQLALLIRRLCCYKGRGGLQAAVVITNTILPAASASSLHRSVSSGGRTTSISRSHSLHQQQQSTGQAQTQHQQLHVSGSWAVWSGVVDNLLLVEREVAAATLPGRGGATRGDAGSTVVKVTALQRPPFFQGLPMHGIISFPWQ